MPTVPGPGQFARLARSAEDALRDAPAEYGVVGALPFHEHTPATLTLAPVSAAPRAPHRRALPPGPTVAGPPGDCGYLAAVAEAVRCLRAGAAHKVVLARSLHVPGLTPDDAPAVLSRLVQQQPTAHVFCVNVAPAARDSPRLLIGASPELLLARSGDRLLLNPLAGSAPRHTDRAHDRAAARALLASPKDRREHALVVTELRRQLAPWCRALQVPGGPGLKATGQLWHLSTVIRARLRHPAPNALQLAAVLHPTPAVCGVPREAARRLIEQLEIRPRGYFTGLIGWMDRHGDGRWVIALRCGELSPHGLRLHAGAGILGDSRPEAELAETGAKLATLLGALTP
ncbi:isochorismate synthase [Streptomyces gobiensis]|uniref:isochorismate synthase n=1 Tax=Streptomyces gobiensis TaxID=2875706 RepID=UPI001E2840DA|nr:isochorismate synthase [Streptomyces gobiensis]UGY94910.1 isochorismate synthase [Streptomyces gobiensis]